MALLEKAIKNKTRLKITYLKPNDEKSVRVIRPEIVGKMKFQDKIYTGVLAFCELREDYRTFRIDRILEINEI